MSNLGNDEQKILRLYEFGNFVLDMDDPPENRLVLNGDKYEISDRTFDLLRIFVKNFGKELKTEELVNALWSDYDFKPGDLHSVRQRRAHTKKDDDNEEQKRQIRNNLQKQVYAIRKSIGRESIETTEAGYIFTIPVNVREIAPKADLNFEKWITKDVRGRRIIKAVAAGVMLSVAYSVVYFFLSDDSWFNPRVVYSLIQALMILAALLINRQVFNPDAKNFWEYDPPWLMKKFGYDEPAEWRNAKAGAKIALNDYAVHWKYLLISWLSIYALLFLTLLLDSARGWPPLLLYALNVALTASNNCNSLMITLCFIILNNPTAYGSAEAQERHKAWLRKIRIRGAVAIGVFALVEAVLLFAFETDAPDSVMNNPVIRNMDIISGIVGGITLALYVGRVQTRFLGPSPWISLAFYLYAVIQPHYLFIKDYVRGEIIIEAALILKALLYLYVAWLLQSGRLLFYFVRVRAMFERADLDWRTFLSILR